MSPTAQGVDRIRRLAHRAERRMRTGRASRVLAQALSAALLGAIAIVALRKTGVLGEPLARTLLIASIASVVLASAIAWVWPLPEKAGARALDRFHGLHDRLASALAFAEVADAERTPFMQAAMSDAAESLRSVVPRKAVPIGFPRAFFGAAALAAALVGVSFSEVRRHVPFAHARTIDAIEMAPDDLQDVKEFLKQQEDGDSSNETKAAVEEFNKLVDDIAERRLGRTEAFRRMEVLEQKFLTTDAVDKKTLEHRLEGLGEELKKAELSRPAGRALADQDLAKAEASLRELAKKMRSSEAPVDKAKLDELRQALKKASEERQKDADALSRRREQLADEILKLKEKMGDGGTDEERSLLEKKKEELERLDRDTSDAKQNEQHQTLDRLDRDIQQAAEDLLHDLGASAQDLDQGAEDLDHLQDQQMTQQQKEELRQKLQEMRELLRQQGQGGKAQMMRLKRFARMARGEGGSPGQSGDGTDGQGQQQGQQGQGQSGQQGQGQGQQGQGQDGQGGGGKGAGQGGETWVVGPNGEKLLLLSRGSGQGQGGSQAGQGGEGEGQGQPGSWGEGHDPNVQGKATGSKMGTEETHVDGADTGQGASRSQVIQGAAERGFASRSYRKVYTEYHQVAEESLAKDDIPDGYRSFVKRYFQLIRPREQR